MKHSILLALLAMMLVSCSTVRNKGYQSATIDTGIKSSLKADIGVDMSKKLKGVASKTKIFGFTTSGPNKYADGVSYGMGADHDPGFLTSLFSDATDEVKAAAAYNALQGAGADLLIAPSYIVEKTSFPLFYSKIIVEVTGYAGTVKKIE